MKILKNALLFGTGLTAGLIGGIFTFACSASYREDHPDLFKDLDEVYFADDGTKITIFRSKVSNQKHFWALCTKSKQDET